MTFLVPVVLILVGLALLAVEVYLVPGVNVVGVLGVLAAGVGVVYAFVTGGTLGGFLALLGAVAGGGLLFTYLWRSGAWDRFVLADELRPDPLEAGEEQETRARLLGRTGVAVTPLRPTGVVEIDGTRVEVLTEGAFVAAGSRVRVVAMDRRRYFVRLADEAEAPEGQ
ncbi:MAG TPA: NfeD family protein [Rubricoccaceae bacterium]|nr:NfeD family protein [Rubricoccaceae bacterium]